MSPKSRLDSRLDSINETSLKYQYSLLEKRLTEAKGKLQYEIALMNKSLGYPHVASQDQRIDFAKGGVKKVEKQLEKFEKDFPEFFI